MCKTPQTYHWATAYDRYAMDPHAMDWANQPNPYKSYPGHDGVTFPGVTSLFAHDLVSVYDINGLVKRSVPPDLEILSKICLLAGGLTARSRQGNGYFYFRSAPSAGALYPNEIYYISLNNDAVPAGSYHCGMNNRLLTRLRPGNFERRVKAAIQGLMPDASGVFVISGIFFRSAWKYRKRAYRYVMLDGGHLCENLRLAISAAGYAFCLNGSFEDNALATLLGLDPQREGLVCCVGIGGIRSEKELPEAEMMALPESISAASCVSPEEVVYPEITGIHEAAKTVETPFSATDAMIDQLGIFPADGYVSFPEAGYDQPLMNYSETVFARRSRRNFIPMPMAQAQFAYLLNLLSRASNPLISEDIDVSSSVGIGFLAGNVKGLESGFYLSDPDGPKIGRVVSGQMMDKMTAVCLDQAWLKNAAVHFVFMSNLKELDKNWGARGYRYAMLTAGRLGHALYLGATAMNLGCCGIGAFYDNEAQALLGLNEDSALFYLVAVGNIK